MGAVRNGKILEMFWDQPDLLSTNKRRGYEERERSELEASWAENWNNSGHDVLNMEK